ncbi:MAG TPA: acetyl-CoA C-acetyltransferase [Acidobacteriota bacterium]|jgi:acetyl-CoA C-acetyltransferase|nr:acetyl-CoA C-acetyltransferase [Acidobacteriota bacterium]
MQEAFIVSAVRTPIGKFLGGLKSLSATQLGANVVREAVRRAGLRPEDIEEVVMGNVVSAGLGQNPARQAALNGGLPATVSAMTINKVCGSGLKAVSLAAQSIRALDQDIIVAGGMESMSTAPYLLPHAREGLRLGHGELIDSMILDGLWDAYEHFHMGCTGEVVSEKYHISRQEQDEYAMKSHQKALAAIKAGRFKDEIVPVEVPQKKGSPVIFDTDEGPRGDTSLEALARLKPAFKPDGTVTAGNAPGVNDGAAAVVVASERKVKEKNLRSMARIVAYSTSGIEPSLVMMAPLEAVRKIWTSTGWKANDVDLYELNEAFSVQSVALIRELQLDPARVNVHGGAVALGHPIGASGARILVTLLYALLHSGKKRGIAALCLGGGNAVGMAVELL